MNKSIRLPEQVLERLREWLTEESYERGEAWDLPEWRADRAIIYHQFGLGRPIPHGSYSILSCLFAGLLVRDDPDWEGWLAVLAEHLKREDSPRVWQSLSRMIVWVVRADKERASAFPDSTIRQISGAPRRDEWVAVARSDAAAHRSFGDAGVDRSCGHPRRRLARSSVW